MAVVFILLPFCLLSLHPNFRSLSFYTFLSVTVCWEIRNSIRVWCGMCYVFISIYQNMSELQWHPLVAFTFFLLGGNNSEREWQKKKMIFISEEKRNQEVCETLTWNMNIYFSGLFSIRNWWKKNKMMEKIGENRNTNNNITSMTVTSVGKWHVHLPQGEKHCSCFLRHQLIIRMRMCWNWQLKPIS